MTGPLQIKVLGELAVLRHGAEIALPQSKKTRALFAYLAVVNRRQRRDHLCRMFWDTPDDPRAALRWSLTKIRHLLGDDNLDGLNSDRDSVQLDAARFDMDLHRVEHLTAEKLRTLSTTQLEDLADHFRGRFLDGLDLPHCPVFEAWRIFQAGALDHTRALILRTLVARLEDDPGRAAVHASALQQMTPGETQLSRPTVVDGEPRAEASRSQVIRYCQSPDGVRIAYAIAGTGPPLLRAAHWMSHLQFAWESPVWRHWIDALSRTNTLVRYDERGNGLSDWDAAGLSFECMVADLESVADASGLGRFPLLGVSQSCAVSVAYAVRHPERLSCLVLYGGFARGWRRRGDAHQADTHDAMTTLIREGWGMDNPAFRQLFTETFIPGASREQMTWFNDLQRVTATPLNASRLLQAFGDTDVSEWLARVRVPTLVLHARGDAAVPFDEGKRLAAGIPGARFVDLDSANHILLADEPAFGDFLRETRAFLAEHAAG